MNPQYKLVVVTPFDNYQRGNVIIDQSIVNAILDVNNEMHHYDSYVRKVLLSDEERNILISSSIKEEKNTLTLSSVKK